MGCLGCGPDPGVVQSADRALVDPISSCRPPIGVYNKFTYSFSALDAYNSLYTTTTTTTSSSATVTLITTGFVDATSGQFVAGVAGQTQVQQQ